MARAKPDRRERIPKAIKTLASVFVADFGGPDTLGAIGQSLAHDLAVITVRTDQIAERIARGERVSSHVHSRLLARKQALTKTLKELTATPGGDRATQTVPVTRRGVDAMRARSEIVSVAREVGQDFLVVLRAYEVAREAGISLEEFLAQLRAAVKFRDAIDSTALLLPAPDDTKH